MNPKELRTRRLEAGWSQQELADRCRLPLVRIQAFEQGEAEIDCADLLEQAFRSGEDLPEQ